MHILEWTARYSGAVRFRGEPVEGVSGGVEEPSMMQLTRSVKKHAAAVLLSLLGASTVGHAEVNVSGTVASIRIVTSLDFHGTELT
jgi:hypothetical protein